MFSLDLRGTQIFSLSNLLEVWIFWFHIFESPCFTGVVEQMRARRSVYVAGMGKGKIVAGFTLEIRNEEDHCEKW